MVNRTIVVCSRKATDTPSHLVATENRFFKENRELARLTAHLTSATDHKNSTNHHLQKGNAALILDRTTDILFLFFYRKEGEKKLVFWFFFKIFFFFANLVRM